MKKNEISPKAIKSLNSSSKSARVDTKSNVHHSLPMHKQTLEFAVVSKNGVVESIGHSYITNKMPNSYDQTAYAKELNEMNLYKTAIKEHIDNCENMEWLKCIHIYVSTLLS